ncbi:MAG: putative LPS assembly protein LptD [Gemmatimonas sp.]
MIPQDRRTLRKAAVWCAMMVGVWCGASQTLGAQVTPPTRPPDTQPPVTVPLVRSLPPDTAKKPGAPAKGLPVDTIRRNGKLDTIPKLKSDKVLFDWDPPDSTMSALDKRLGYRKVQYQGDSIRFDAKTGLLQLGGKPSAVKRDETMLVGPVIIYDDSAKKVQARAEPGDSVTLRDPSQRSADDFVVKGGVNYDLSSRSATVGAFETSVEAGADRLYLSAKGGQLFSDTLVSGKHIVWASDGSFTYCDLIEPHFHFTTKSMKFISDNIMVARPGVLYIGEVPVFWIPFFFQDVRKGRRSGLLTPNFGIAELLRNSPTYRREVRDIGYYFAINDYMGAQTSFDWRSGANQSAGDQGFVRANLEWTYNWINRFVTGRFSADELFRNDGQRNLSVTWNHNQKFSNQTRLSSAINWVQSTSIQRETTINPVAQTATIGSSLNYQTRLGPTSINIGGQRRQYPGRSQVDYDFPSGSISSKPLAIGKVLSWTPTATFHISGSSKLDQGVQFPFLYTPKIGGGTDSVRINASTRHLDATFSSPLTIFGWSLSNDFTLTEDVHNFPEALLIKNVNNPADSVRRIFSKTFQTNFRWTPRFTLPSFFHSTFALSPTLTFDDVDPQGGLLVRSERSGGRWVSQTKRPSIGVSSSPALAAIFRGIGPVEQFRHTISPSISWNYAPAAEVSDEFLGALGRTRTGYLGALAQNRVALGLSTTLEGKLRARSDTASDAPGRKMTFLALNFSPLSWDFIRADTASTGLSETSFSISGRSDLLPGLDFRTSYSIFDGDPLSDSSRVKLFRTDLGANFSLNSKSPIFAVLGKLLGLHGTSLESGLQAGALKTGAATDLMADKREQSEASGTRRRGSGVNIPQGQGWSLNLQYSGARTRPTRGATVVQETPEAFCDNILKISGYAAFLVCVEQVNSAPPASSSLNTKIGATPFESKPTQNIASNLTFNVTPSWAAQWTTSYDVVRKRFATQQVGLQRQLHDWTTTFSFTQSPNGAFSFSFFIAMKAQPSIKFPYNRSTYRSGN